MPLAFVKLLPKSEAGEEQETGRGRRDYHTGRGLSSAAVSGNDQLGNCAGVPEGDKTCTQLRQTKSLLPGFALQVATDERAGARVASRAPGGQALTAAAA